MIVFYVTEEILNTHLCPDPVLTHGSKLPAIFPSPNKIMSVSLQRSIKPKDRTNTYFSRFRPCTFIEDTSTILGTLFPHHQDNNATLVRIRSINLNTEPWNFSSAAECSKFIMFRSWGEYGNGYPVMCGRDNFDQYLGPYGHPMILYYHLKEHGISFPLFHPNYGQNFRDQKDILELKYMLIYYSLKKDGVWTCRLQQYTLDPLQQGCSYSASKKTTICGEYSCTELESLYQKKMSVMRDGEFHQPRFVIVKSKTQEKYRVRNFLRQKFVPIVFLLVLIFAYKSYMKAGLRLNEPLPLPASEMRLRRYHHQRQNHFRSYLDGDSGGRDHYRDIYFEFGGRGGIPGLHIPYDDSTSRPGGTSPGDTHDHHHHNHNFNKYLVPGGLSVDPPPPYESLFPPTYTEATAAAPKNPKV